MQLYLYCQVSRVHSSSNSELLSQIGSTAMQAALQPGRPQRAGTGRSWADVWGPCHDLADAACPVLTSHMFNWKLLRSFSISSAISPPLTSPLTMPCCFASSRFSFSIFVLKERGQTPERLQPTDVCWRQPEKSPQTQVSG